MTRFGLALLLAVCPLSHAAEPHPTGQFWDNGGPGLDFYDQRTFPELAKEPITVGKFINMVSELNEGGCDHYWTEPEEAYTLECAIVVRDGGLVYNNWRLEELPGRSAAAITMEVGDGKRWDTIPQSLLKTQFLQLALLAGKANVSSD